jgi:hypothetical protein
VDSTAGRARIREVDDRQTAAIRVVRQFEDLGIARRGSENCDALPGACVEEEDSAGAVTDRERAPVTFDAASTVSAAGCETDSETGLADNCGKEKLPSIVSLERA